jgi:uncharacterized protein
MVLQTRPALDESLSDPEYDRLAEILDHDAGPGGMNLEEMDGFFAALISGPVTVPPSKYLDEIWGNEGAPFETIAELEEFLNLAMRHWNFTARVLANPDMVFVPWLIPAEGEQIPRGNRWAHGFMRGVEMCRDEWNEIFQDEKNFAMILPVLALVHENDPDKEMRTWKTPPNPELREKVLIGLSMATQRLYDYFRARRARLARAGQKGIRTPAQKIGRNDPCFCGSGKKYKRCCGNVTVH